LDHPFKKCPVRRRKIFLSSFPACKQRRVGVQSDVVTRVLMLERQYSQMMEELLVWLVL
jgi:hypothetical protein